MTKQPALDSRSQLLWDMLDQSPDIIVCYDVHLRRTYVNAMYVRHTGRAASQVLGRSIDEHSVVGAATGDLVACLKRALDTGEAQTLEFEWCNADGQQAWHALRAAVVSDGAGRIVGLVTVARDITQSKRTERSARTLNAIFDSTTDYVVQLDPRGRFIYMNPAARRRAGVPPDAPLEHLTMADFNPPHTLERIRSEIVPTALAAGVWVGESLVRDADRHEFPVGHMVIAHRDRHGRVEYFSGLMRDISAAKATEQALQQSEARLRTVADALPVRVAYIDADERYRFNNLAYERGFGLSRDAIQGRTVRELLGEAAYRAVEPHIRAVLGGAAVTFQSEMISDDSYVCYEAHYIPQLAASGEAVVGFHAVITDITRQKLEEKRLVNLARVDALTGVVNRAGFELRLAEAMGRSRGAGTLMALMYLDIDHFKQINDRYGHVAGDALLRAFAGRLTQTLRSTDTVARLGGDEFTVMLEGVPSSGVAASVAAKIVRAMSTPFVIEQQSIAVTTSIGLACYQGGDVSTETLIKQADEMLYQAKAAGRNTYRTNPLSRDGA